MPRIYSTEEIGRESLLKMLKNPRRWFDLIWGLGWFDGVTNADRRSQQATGYFDN